MALTDNYLTQLELGTAAAPEWAEPEDLEWPLRRVIDQVDRYDLLDCGHQLVADVSEDHYKVFVYGRRCPVCHADSGRDQVAELRAYQEFLRQFGWRPKPLLSVLRNPFSRRE